jgi:outer membrane usher protein
MRIGHRLLAGALIVAALGARAQQPDQRLLADLCVNGSCYGTAFVLLQHGHVLVDADALKRAKVAIDGITPVVVSGHDFIDLSTYDRGSSIHFNDTRTRLDLTLPASAFGAQTVELGSGAHRVVPPATSSAFLNYAASAGSGNNNSLFLDAGVTHGASLFGTTAQWTSLRGWSRGLTHYDYDDLEHLRRYTIGDQFAFSRDGLGGAVLMGGVGIVRAYDLDPYLITFPQPTIAGLLQAPGTIDIYKNGVLIGQRQVNAGPFDLAGLGVGPGANDVRVVVHDPFGGTRVLNQNFYGASAALAPGLSEFAYQLGVERPSIEQNGYEGDQPVLLARQRWGFSDRITAGYRLEAGRGLVNAGPNADFRLPLGFLHLALAASRDHGVSGHAETATYQFIEDSFSFSTGLSLFSSGYRRLGDDNVFFRPRDTRYVSASYTPRQRFSLFFNADSTRYDNGVRQRSIGIGATLNLGYGSTLLVSLTRRFDRPGPNDNEALVNFVIPLGNRDSFGFNLTHAQGDTGYGISAQRSLPSDTGYGYSLDARHDDIGVSGRGEFDYQNAWGRVGVIGESFGGHSDGSVLLSGSIIGLGGHVFAARPSETGYALVEVPDLAGVKVTRENLPVGRTDANGDLLVPGLLPYQPNRIGIDQATVPVTDAIGATDIITSVPRFGGTVVRFDVHPLLAAKGRLTLAGTPVKFGSLSLSVDGKEVISPVGLDGSFYFADLPGGEYSAQLRNGGQLARCELHVPRRKAPVVDLGEIACTSNTGSP